MGALKRFAVVVALTGAVVWGALEYARRTLQAPFGYCLEAEFADFPADDRPLVRWLRQQPGVIPRLICVSRESPDGKRLKVSFTQVRNYAGHPALPALDRCCGELGYARPAYPFRDCRDRDAAQHCCD